MSYTITSEAATRGIKLDKLHRKTPVLESPFNKVAGLKVCKFIKKDSNRGAFCENYQICENTCFQEHLWTTASVTGYFCHVANVFI